MADFKVDGPELKKLVAVMRRQPIAFAFNPAKKDEDHYLGLDRRKAPDVLGRDAKKNGEGSKVAFGMATIEGKIVSLRCEKVVQGVSKKLKRYLKIQKLSYNVEVLDENGNVVEADIEDLPEDPEDQAENTGTAPAENTDTTLTENTDQTQQTETAPETPQGPDKAALMARLAACKPQLQAAAPQIAKPLMQNFTNAAAQLKAGDLAATLAEIETLEQALANPATEAPAQENGLSRKEVQAELVALGGKIRTLPEGQAAKLDAPFKNAAEMLKAGELEKSKATIDKISAAYDTLAAQSASPAQDAGALAQQAKALRDDITALSDEGARAKLMADLGKGVGHIKSGALDEAATTFTALADAIASIGAPPANPDKAAFNALWPGLEPQVDAEIAPKGPMSTALNAAKMAVQDAVAAGDFAKALVIAKRLEAKLPDATAARLAAEQAAKGTMNSVNFATTRLNWGTARKALRGEMKVLADAIVNDLKGGDVEGIESAVNDLYGYLDPIDEALEDELDRLITATDTGEMKTLRDNCLGIIATFKQELSQGIFADIDSNNGFKEVAVQKNALAALDAVANDIKQAAQAA